MAMIQATWRRSLPTRTGAVVLMTAAAVVIAALTGCSGSGVRSSAMTSTASSVATGLSTFREQGLVFDYPAGWREFHYDNLSTRSNFIAYLGTVNVPKPCLTTAAAGGDQTECRDRFLLLPNTLVVAIRTNGYPMFDILDRPAGTTPVTVGGLPGYRAISSPAADDATGAETIVTITLAMPGLVDNYYTITAALRGPDIGPLEAQVDALTTSLRYDPPVVPLQSGSGAAAAAAASALVVLGKDSPSWACFVPVGTHQLIIDSLPMGPALAHPQLATCTSSIEATPLQLWRMTLTMRLSEPDANAGPGQTFVVWVNPDGTPGQTSGGPLAP